LPVGSYKAFILRNNGLNGNGGFVAVAVSATFTVKANTAVSTGTAAAVASAKSDISNIIVGNGGNSDLAAMFLRLAFHDCVGGCDGCVDLTNPENFGLSTPIQALRPVVSKFANSQTKLTRADIWALSSAVGAEVMQTTDRVSFDLLSVGRVNCENANTVCRNEQGNVHDCSDIRGPSRNHPSMNLNSRDLFGFFSDEFGFSTKQTVAIMGAHTLGKLRKANSGVDGPNGWLINNKVFDNGE
jgi:cytochrome c peroxidase